MGIYSPTGSGKTFWRNTIVEVSLWAHDTNIVINDRKLDTLGFLIPQDPSIMTNAPFFPNPRTGEFPIKPDCLPHKNFHLWLPATHYSYYDELIEELMEWGVVHWYRFHPRMFIDSTIGDYIPGAVGMTRAEALATSRALLHARGKLEYDSQKENWNLSDLKEGIKSQEQLHGSQKPYEKLFIMEDSGIISKEENVELIHRNTGEHMTQKVTVLRNIKDIIKSPTNLHMFTNKYMSSPTADNTLSTAINYMLFSLIRETCENIPKKRRVLVHLPEAEYSLAKTASETQNNSIKSYFSNSYGDALRESRQYQMYNILDTQQVTELPSRITSNQMTIWLMPGFKHRSELNWLKGGIGRAQMGDRAESELFSMNDPFQNRGKGFYIGQDKAVKVWNRPRQTYHFREGNDMTELLKNYREVFGLDNAEKWRRWDE